jgi:hypothetical protein
MSTSTEKDAQAGNIAEKKLQERVAKLKRDYFRKDGGPTRDEKNGISVRLTDREAKLIGDQISFSSYENLSEYVRAVTLGWDRSAPIIAKSGVVIHWVRAWMEEMTDEQVESLHELIEQFFGSERPTHKAMEPSREEINEHLDKILKVVEEHLLYAKEGTVDEKTGN